MVHDEQTPFGALLRRFRRAACLSQEALAERCGLSMSAISALERGVRRAPYPHTIAQLVAALELSPAERALLVSAASKYPRRRRVTAVSPPPNGAIGAAIAGIVSTAEARVDAVPVLVGRERELAWLQRELAAGSPLVLLTGEPGIGKSRLLRETMSWARTRGWRALWGGCQRSSGQEPYAPLVEALARHIRTRPQELQRLDLASCESLARLLPDVPELAAARQHLVASAALPSAREQRLLFAAVEQYLSNIAGRAGTLLVLDDLQWAGADACHLLARLIQSGHAGRLQILAAYRSTEVPPGHPLSTLIADLARDELVSHIKLAPLEPRDAAALARAVVGREGIPPAARNRAAAADDLPSARVIESVVERGEGVPFFLVSFARWRHTLGDLNDQHEPAWQTAGERGAGSMEARGARTSGPERAGLQRMEEVPWRVAQSIRERVAALPPSAQELLGVAAVVGKRASHTLLAASADQAELETLSGIEFACQAGLLVEDPDDDGQERYRFAHDVVRDVVEASLSAGRQMVLHRRVAVALEQHLRDAGAGRPNSRALSQLAFHYAHANVPEQAALYLRQAGDYARTVFAHEEAAQDYQELVRCLDRLGQSREAARARRDLAVELARVGRFRDAVVPLDQAEQICRATGDVETLALVTMVSGHLHAALGASEKGLEHVQPLVESLAGELRDTGGAEGAAAAGRAVLAEGSGVSARVSAQLQGALSSLYFMAGHYQDAWQAAEHAVGAARVTGDSGLLAREQLVLGVALFTLGRLAEAIEQLQPAAEGAEAVGDLETLAEALRMASWVYQTRGEFAQSQAVQEQGLVVAQRLGDVVGLGHTLFMEALLAFYLGKWGQARTIAETALATFRTLDVSHLAAYPPLGLGWLSTIEGHRDIGERYLAEAEALAQRHGPAQVLRFSTALRAECELLAGKPQEAYDRMLPWFTGDPMQERTRLELSVLRAWAAVELGLGADAEAWVAEAVEGARAGHMHLILPDALRVQALWAMRQRRWEEAERALDEAVSLSHAMPHPYAEAKALYVFGTLWTAMGESARARERFTEALAICRQLGERLYGEVIERSLAAARATLHISSRSR